MFAKLAETVMPLTLVFPANLRTVIFVLEQAPPTPKLARLALLVLTAPMCLLLARVLMIQPVLVSAQLFSLLTTTRLYCC